MHLKFLLLRKVCDGKLQRAKRTVEREVDGLFSSAVRAVNQLNVILIKPQMRETNWKMSLIAALIELAFGVFALFWCSN